jgi:hypothetical protein
MLMQYINLLNGSNNKTIRKKHNVLVWFLISIIVLRKGTHHCSISYLIAPNNKFNKVDFMGMLHNASTILRNSMLQSRTQ